MARADASVIGKSPDARAVTKISEDANRYGTNEVTSIELPSESPIQKPSQLVGIRKGLDQ
jgi:hypothetical protein